MQKNDITNPLYKKLSSKYKVDPISQTKGLRKCKCGLNYIVKFADLKRGWGLSCSKSCACIKQGGFGKRKQYYGPIGGHQIGQE